MWPKENNMINDVTAKNQLNLYQSQKPSPEAKTTVASEQKSSFPGDTVSLNRPTVKTNTYGVNKSSGLVASNFSDVRQMIVNTFKEQGISTRIAAGGTTAIDLKNITQEEAQELISEDGYWGVEQTSDRIVGMAISALGGNDPERLAEIKSGIEKGFQMAAEALGGSLPDISMQTYDAVMEKLDAWSQNLDVA